MPTEEAPVIARTRLAATAAAASLLLAPVVAAPTASAAPGGRIVIGDSVSLGAASQFRARGFRVTAEVSRQFYSAPSIVRSYGSNLPANVVIHLGTNGTITVPACKSVVRAAGTSRRVFLVTNKVPRSWQNSNNAALRSCDAAFPGDRVVLVDWYSASRNKPHYFAGDGYHLTSSGAAALASLVDSAVDSRGV